MTAQPAPPDLRLGRWQDVLEGEECDALIADPPFGKRTHVQTDSRRKRAEAGPGGGRADGHAWSELDYEHWAPENVLEFVGSWAPRVRGWWGCFTSHDLVPSWEVAFAAAGLYSFAPIPVIDRGANARLCGDGPSGWTSWLMVARPRKRRFSTWGTLPGAYTRSPGDKRGTRSGGKPLGVMRAIVRDYSRPGDIVCDPFAGHGTTLLAALTEGRGALGSEVDPDAHAAACARLAEGYTLDMFARLA